MKTKSWILSPVFDTVFILFPPFACLLIIFLFPGLFDTAGTENEWIWFLLVVCIDVGHVYSTIYRTYMDKETISKNKLLFYLSPVAIYFVCVLMHSMNPLFFWRGMAYLAVFHFIRQQYGFLRLYSRKEQQSLFYRSMDTITIYAATLYPLVYWHLQGKQQFNWFVDNDFVYINQPWLIPVFQIIYVLVLLLYIAKEVHGFIKSRQINIPKNILVAGTVLSWYIGIVYLKGDLTFTLLNVVSHGVPYYALVWAFGNKQQQQANDKPSRIKLFFKPQNILLFLGFLLLLAYMEELLWDGFVWKEHTMVFPTTAFLPDISDSKSLMSLLVPLLALPQLLHYFIDGFIWKIKKDRYGWSTLLLGTLPEKKE
ncbi:MAG: hypothetical protein WAQ28_11440 [Bacteroidia bacterium]